ncbi:hemerythrin domain-containing protein, partial [Streptomyces sp. SID3343]|nr:hemerythrin domain-containing protein [Streptomyces sp. SID3343]
LAAVDAALADGEAGAQRLGAIVDRLVTGLGGHLRHEEDDALDLIDAYATSDLLQRFGAAHATRIGPDGSRYLPWLLDGASEERTDAVLGRLPEPARSAFHGTWRPAYIELNRWAGTARTPR